MVAGGGWAGEGTFIATLHRTAPAAAAAILDPRVGSERSRALRISLLHVLRDALAAWSIGMRL